ncbi:MAG: cytochrome c [Gammaproteobacteria bacterium]|nr:cytochrome c [Gammaproteobacteria bacterium]
MRLVVFLLLSGILVSGNSLAAGDPAAGKSKSMVCAGCHGMNGYSSNDLWPNLAGQKKGYLVQQIKAFRDGVRDDPMMKPMVANLSDQDIEDLAAYYAGLK